MKLTSRARNAVTAMTDLARATNGAPVPLAAIAERQVLSLAFLEQIFGQLRRAGLVESRRGIGGGYLLARPASEIAVADIVRAMEEQIRTTACVPGAAVGCGGTSARCLTHHLWSDLDSLIDDYLSGLTVADILARAPVGAGSREAVADA